MWNIRGVFMDYDNSILARRLSEQIKKNNMTFSEVSRLTGIAQGVLTKICNGQTRNPQINSVYKIAKVLNVTIDYLVGFEDELNVKLSSPVFEDRILIKDKGVQIYLQLDGEDRAEIRGRIMYMLNAPKYENDLYVKRYLTDEQLNNEFLASNTNSKKENSKSTNRELFASHLQMENNNDRQGRELFSGSRPGNVAAYGREVTNVEIINADTNNED